MTRLSPLPGFPGRIQALAGTPGGARIPARLGELSSASGTAQHATICLSVEADPEDRAAKPGDTRLVPGEPCLTGGLAGPGSGQVTDLTRLTPLRDSA
jgi:hypothetical protein